MKSADYTSMFLYLMCYNQNFYSLFSRKNSTLPSHLVGDETMDQKIVCDWFASSYGEVDKEYHEGGNQVQLEYFQNIKLSNLCFYLGRIHLQGGR